MNGFVRYEKLGKKQKKALDAKKRVTWGAMSPVTRKKESAKIYNRKKRQLRTTSPDAGAFLIQSCC